MGDLSLSVADKVPSHSGILWSLCQKDDLETYWVFCFWFSPHTFCANVTFKAIYKIIALTLPTLASIWIWSPSVGGFPLLYVLSACRIFFFSPLMGSKWLTCFLYGRLPVSDYDIIRKAPHKKLKVNFYLIKWCDLLWILISKIVSRVWNLANSCYTLGSIYH